MGLKDSVKQQAYKITSDYEGAGFTELGGQSWGQYMVYGFLQWNFAVGVDTLQPLFNRLFKEFPQVAIDYLPNGGQSLKDALANGTERDWALSQQSNGHFVDPWKTALHNLGNTSEFQQIQLDAAEKYVNDATDQCNYFGVTTDRAFCLLFDIAVQNGSAPKFSLDPNLSYLDKLKAIAEATINRSIGDLQQDVRDRKMTIVNGSGNVHGENFNFSFSDSDAFGGSDTSQPHHLYVPTASQPSHHLYAPAATPYVPFTLDQSGFFSGTIKEKSIEGIPGYAVFLDNVRVDQYVKSFDVTLASNGSIGNASIEMVYVPDFYKIEKVDESGKTVAVYQGIENMTNIKIFVKNMFSQKYVMIFDGNIKGKSRTKSPGGFSLIFNAADYMTWLNRTVVPIAIPQSAKLNNGDRLKWEAQGIDVEQVSSIQAAGAASFKGKTLTEYINLMKDRTVTNNRAYSNSECVAYWDAFEDRLSIMADIDPNLISNDIVDFVITSTATIANSLYVAINDIVKNLTFEFFQDRDGVIRIKPPYWCEPVLRDHIIDPGIMTAFSENTNWNNYITRVIVTGGIEEYMNDQSAFYKSITTPCGAYVGNPNADTGIWVDAFAESSGGGVKGSTSAPYNESKSYSLGMLTGHTITLGYLVIDKDHPSPGHKGVDFAFDMGQELKHVGWRGLAKYDYQEGGYGNYVYVRLVEGPYEGWYLMYGHMSEIDSEIKNAPGSDGFLVSHNVTIGKAGSTGHSSGPHLHLQVARGRGQEDETMDPGVYIEAYVVATSPAQTTPPTDSFAPKDWLAVQNEKSNIQIQNVVNTTGVNTFSHAVAADAEVQAKIAPEYMREAIVVQKTIQTDYQLGSDEDLLAPSIEEKKYGLSVFDTVQPLIKYSNSGAMAQSVGQDALKKYAMYLYNLTNSMTEVASLSTIAMPWLRPGFNVWVDPVGVDKVYYIDSLTHYGSAEGGVYTSLNLSLGRERVNFTNSTSFGSLSSGNENLFISNFFKHSSDFGAIIGKAEFDVLRNRCLEFYKNEGNSFQVIKADSNKYFTDIYGKTNFDKSISSNGPGKLSPNMFVGEYSLEEIQTKLDSAYASAPAVVRSRVSKLKVIMSRAIEYVKTHYITES